VQTNFFKPALAALATNLTLSDHETAWYCVRVFGGDAQRQRAISGAFFLDATPHRPPEPVPAKIRVTLQDAVTGANLSGSITEILFPSALLQPTRSHVVAGTADLIVPAHTRLRATATGYEPMTLSPFLDNPALLSFVTQLDAAALLRWETFERVRSLLGEVTLTFRLEKAGK
jgi:hypothetical protein